MQFLYESGGGTGNIFYIRDLKNSNSQFTKVVPNMDLSLIHISKLPVTEAFSAMQSVVYQSNSTRNTESSLTEYSSRCV